MFATAPARARPLYAYATAWPRALAAVALCAALGAGAARAADANAPPAANTGGTLIYYDAVGNETLDPAEPQSSSSFSQEVLSALYDTLIGLDDAGQPKPALAESWSYNADLSAFTMKLRHGVRFHDGTPFNAEAVKRNLERSIALGGRASTTVSEALKPVAGIEVSGDDTVTLKLNPPSGQMEYALGFVSGMMVSPASLAEGAYGGTLKPVGTGPYRLKSFEANIKTVLARNDEYWGGVAGRPASFEHHYVPDGRARLNALRSGQANIVLIDPRQIPEAKGAGLQVQINEKNGVWDIYTNLSRPALANLKVRQAIMHAIDREALAEALSFGSGKPTSQLFASASPVYIKELDALYPFDQKKARGLLAEAGYKDGVEITQLLLNTSEYRQLGEALQAMLAEVGIRVKFDTIDASQFPLFRKPPTRGDILMARWGGRADALQTFQEIAGSTGSFNPGGAATPEIDALIGKARGLSPSDPRRLEVLRQLNRVVVEHAANFPIMTRSNVYAFRPGCISNLPPYLPTGDDRFNGVRLGAGCR